MMQQREQGHNRLSGRLAPTVLATLMMVGCHTTSLPPMQPPASGTVLRVSDQAGGRVNLRLYSAQKSLRTQYKLADIDSYKVRLTDGYGSVLYTYEGPGTELSFSNIPVGEVRIGVYAYKGTTIINRDLNNDGTPDEAYNFTAVTLGQTSSVIISLNLADSQRTQTIRRTQMDADINARVAYNSDDNEYLLVWGDYYYHPATAPDGAQICAQRISATGAMLGNLQILSEPNSYSEFPEVAYNSVNNEYFVVWEDFRRDVEVYGQRVGADGTPIGSNLNITSAGEHPNLIYNSNSNEYLVAWSDSRDRPPASDQGYYAQRISGATGNLVGSDILIASSGSAANDAYENAIAYNSIDHEYLTVWAGGNLATSSAWAQRISEVGALIGGNIDISTSGAREVDVDYNPTANEYMTTWANGGKVYFQLVDADGTLLGSNVEVIEAESDAPAIVYNPDKDVFMLAFAQGSTSFSSGSGWSGATYTVGQAITPSGLLSGPRFIFSTDRKQQTFPEVTYNTTLKEYFAVWLADPYNDYGSGAIFFQRVK